MSPHVVLLGVVSGAEDQGLVPQAVPSWHEAPAIALLPHLSASASATEGSCMAHGTKSGCDPNQCSHLYLSNP